MKNFIYALTIQALFFIAAVGTSFGQAQPPRYATLELFTNTPCPSCVNQNPGFFNLLNGYTGSVHQISFYPGRPYASCPLYQDNTDENIEHRSHRNLIGTPRVYFNGINAVRSGSVTAAMLDEATTQKSFLHVMVTESTSPTSSVEITLTPYGMPNANSGELYVMLVERDVTLTDISSSWEDEHFNVFRKFIVDGSNVDLTSTSTQSFSYTLDPSWNASKMYVLAWVEDTNTGEIFNSGTRFDPTFSNTNAVELSNEITASPNPFNDQINFDFGTLEAQSIDVINAQGKVIQTFSRDLSSIETSSWASGVYHILIQTDAGRVNKRVVKK